MNFSEALVLLKAGARMARECWNPFADKDWNKKSQIFIYLVKGSKFKVNRPPLNMKHAHGACSGTWTANNSDVLADDWVELK
jgi:hypothetical protein